MRPAVVAGVFIVVAMALWLTTASQAAAPASRRIRRRLAGIFLLVSAGLLMLDWLTR